MGRLLVATLVLASGCDVILPLGSPGSGSEAPLVSDGAPATDHRPPVPDDMSPPDDTSPTADTTIMPNDMSDDAMVMTDGGKKKNLDLNLATAEAAQALKEAAVPPLDQGGGDSSAGASDGLLPNSDGLYRPPKSDGGCVTCLKGTSPCCGPCPQSQAECGNDKLNCLDVSVC